MGHEQRGDAELPLEPLQLELQVLAQAAVEVRERLVEEQHVGLHDERPRHGDALALPAGELGGAPLVEADQAARSRATPARSRASALPTERMRRPKATLSSTFMCGKRA